MQLKKRTNSLYNVQWLKQTTSLVIVLFCFSLLKGWTETTHLKFAIYGESPSEWDDLKTEVQFIWLS